MARPALFRQTLSSLVACDLDGWDIHIGIDPSPESAAFAAIITDVLPDRRYALTENRRRLGVRRNPHAVISRAFAAGADLVLVIEEDFLLAPDALDLARWYLDNHRPHWAALNLLCGACGTAGNLSDPAYPDLVFESRALTSIGLGLTRADWMRLEPIWGNHRRIRSGWDWAFTALLQRTPGLAVVQPVAARATHTGSSGTHCDPVFQARAFDRLALAENGAPGGFRLCRIDTLPPNLVGHIEALQDYAAETGSRFNRHTSERICRIADWVHGRIPDQGPPGGRSRS